EKINASFKGLKRRLHAGEYGQLKVDSGLERVFKYDLFFVLVEAIQNLDELRERYKELLKKYPEIMQTLDRVDIEYAEKLKRLLKVFSASEIEDERTDDQGNTLDLSKSVYSPVHMRTAKYLNINLQRYTEVQDITSRSPIIVSLLQHIDPQMIIDLWNQYHVAEYASGFVDGLRAEISTHVDLNAKLDPTDLVTGYFLWKMQKDKPKREEQRQEFIRIKQSETNKDFLEGLAMGAARGVLNAPQHLTELIRHYRSKLRVMQQASVELQDKEAIESLKEQIAQLENLRVTAEMMDI
ncbi:MAG TPA: hypothetical protein VFY28_02740, partial [Candidatus Paceibacterota bacterium]|nr:hypothetical protein [Candidatus Paceibacterota bacterium]